ncbi:MAG: hypothetical protein ACT4QF_06905 [Sporichthyaceae bacterium]
MSLTFFSAQWCAEALRVVNTNDGIREGLVDPSSFNTPVMFECSDHAGVGSRMDFASGEVTAWTAGTAWGSVDRTGATFSAPLETWRSVVEGERDATLLLMERKLKLKDTKKQAMAANYRAVDAMFKSWGELDTDWDL